MENQEIQTVLMNALSLQNIYITGDNNYFQIIAVSEIFNGMSRVKQQQIVYAPLMEYIVNNRIHAVSISTYTPQEWEFNNNLNRFSNGVVSTLAK